jgi:hypothetical protein
MRSFVRTSTFALALVTIATGEAYAEYPMSGDYTDCIFLTKKETKDFFGVRGGHAAGCINDLSGEIEDDYAEVLGAVLSKRGEVTCHIDGWYDLLYGCFDELTVCGVTFTSCAESSPLNELFSPRK